MSERWRHRIAPLLQGDHVLPPATGWPAKSLRSPLPAIVAHRAGSGNYSIHSPGAKSRGELDKAVDVSWTGGPEMVDNPDRRQEEGKKKR
jgi:hypothetical protein